MEKNNYLAASIFTVIFGTGAALAFLVYRITGRSETIWIGVAAFFIACSASVIIKVSDEVKELIQ